MNEKILNIIHNMVAELARMSVDELDVDENLLELGADSILISELNSHIKNEFDIEIPMNLYFSDTTSVNDIAEYVSNNVTLDSQQNEIVKKEDIIGSGVSTVHYGIEENEDDKNFYQDNEQMILIDRLDETSDSSLLSLLQQQLQLINNQLILLCGNTKEYSKIREPRVEEDNVSYRNNVEMTDQSENDKLVKTNSKTENDQSNRKVAYVPFKPLNFEKKEMSEERNNILKKIEAEYTEKTKSSKAYAAKYRKPYADCRSVSGFRPNMKEMCYQLIFQSSNGSYITDIDHNQYIDLAMDFGVSLFGHNQDFINDAIVEEMKKGYPLSLVSGLAGEVAELFCELTGSERVAFFNSGTEAVMVAVRIARAYTGRKKLVTFAGSYHGTFDGVLGMSTSSSGKTTPIANGILQDYIDNLVILDYGSYEAIEYVVNHGSEIAAVLVEPVQSRRPDLQPKEFVRKLRKITEENGAILIFDEMILGFRLGTHGAQGFYDITADLATYGKICGGGLPVGIVAGKEKYMNCIDGGLWNYGDASYPPDEDKRTFVAGTFCHHPLTMAASKAVLTKVKELGDGLYNELNEKTEYLCRSLNEYFLENEIPITMAYCGSLFRFVLKGNLELFYYLLNLKGVYIWEGRNCFISAAHTYDDLEKVIGAVKWACNELRPFYEKKSVSDKKKIPCSREQQEIVTYEQITSGSGMNEVCLVKVKGELSEEKLANAFEKVCQRHEILSYHLSEDMAYLEKIDNPDFKIKIEKDRNGDLKKRFTEIAAMPFDLRHDTLMKIYVGKEKEEISYVFLKAHHILVDGWSISIILQELIEVYNALYCGENINLCDAMDYSEYLKAVNCLETQQHDEKGMREYLAGQFKEVFLPLDQKKSAVHVGKIVNDHNKELPEGIRKICRKYKCSPFVLLLSAFQTTLHCITDEKDIMVGVPYAGQQKFLMKSLVGNCTVINRIKVMFDAETTLAKIIAENNKILKLYSDNFGKEYLKTANDTKANIIFNFDRIPNVESFKNAEVDLIPIEEQDSAYDLFVNISELNENMIIETVFNADKYSYELVSRWLDAFYEIVNLALHNKCDRIEDIYLFNSYDKTIADKVSSTIEPDRFANELKISAEQFDFNNEKIAVSIKNRSRIPVITGSYGNIYVGKTVYTCYATDYIGRILPSAKLEILGKEQECFERNGVLTGCYAVEQKLKSLVNFTYIEVEYLDGELILYFCSEEPEHTIYKCLENIDRLYRPDKVYICANNCKEQASLMCLDDFGDNETEQKIYETVSRIIGDKNIRLDDNIIEYGINSLKLMHMISELQDKFDGIRITISDFNGNYTIREIAKLVNESIKAGNVSLPKVKIGAETNNRGELSSAQKRMFIANKLHPDSLAYNLPYLISIEGVVDKKRLESTIQRCVEIHPMLRSVFYEDGEQIKYREEDFDSSSIEWVSYGSEEDVDAYINKEIKTFVRPFVVLNETPFRMKIVSYNKLKTFILVDFHHISFDGMSAWILMKDICAIYNGENVEESEYTYDSYVEWQNEFRNTDIYHREVAYWTNRLNTEYTSLDRLREKDYELNGTTDICGIYKMNISEDIFEGLKQNANKLHCTMFSIVSSAVALMLSLYSGEKEFAIGTVVEGRNDISFSNIIGMFVNTLPLLQSIDDSATIKDFIINNNRNNMEAFANSDVPFEKIVELAKVKVVNHRNPIFDFLLTYHEDEIFHMNSGEMSADIVEIPTMANRFDLELVTNCYEHNMEFELLYTKGLYSDDGILAMMRCLEKIFNIFSENVDGRIDEILFCNPNVLKEINPQLDRTEVNYPNNETVVSLFNEQVKKRADKTAILFKGEAYTYGLLNERANRLAHSLRDKGLQNGELVGVVAERSFEMIVALIATVKAGGIYVPIDPIYPIERRKYIIEDSKTKFILKGHVDLGCFDNREIIDLEEESSYSNDISEPDVLITPENGIYVIYTSGTTGNPKGVMIQHKNIVRLFRNDEFEFDFDENDCWTMFHSFCFDFSVWEMYGALLNGGKLVLPERETVQNSKEFLELLEREKVTVLNQVPSAFYQLMNVHNENKTIRLEKLRYLIFGGEALEPARLRKWKKNNSHVKIINMYGITETTVHVTYKEIGDQEIENGISDIGMPIPTLGMYIMRGKLLCDIGMPGEICVYGEGLGLGYLNRPELNTSKFVENPYRAGRMYRSGDLARILPDGKVEYLGRIDQQIKIRGFRIELDEIAIVLRGLPNIQDSVVIIKNAINGEKAIHAYVVSDIKVDFTEIRKLMKHSLPDYMIPAYFCQLDSIPLTFNGKLNRKALPDLVVSGNDVTQPRNDMEREVKDIFLAVLKIKEMGIYDNFFEVGGHSLKAVEAINAIKKRLNVAIEIGEFFRGGTIEDVANIIEREKNKSFDDNEPELKALHKKEGVLSLNQKELYEASIITDHPEVYNICYPIIFKAIDSDIVEKTLKTLLERHSILRTQLIEKDGEILQRIMPVTECMNKVYQYIGKDNEVWSQNKIKQFIHVYVNYKFKMLDNYLLRIHLVKLDEDRFLMIYLTHHILSDAWSFKVFMKDFLRIYKGIEKNGTCELQRLPIQYLDYSIWQRGMVNSSSFMQKEKKYWEKIFESAIEKINLHTDYERTYPRSMEGDSIEVSLSKKEMEHLKEISVKHNGSIFTAFMSCINILMYMYTGKRDLILGTIVAGRNDWRLEEQIGYYVNLIPIRTKFEVGATVEEVIKATNDACTGAFANQGYPYEFIVTDLNKSRKSKASLFDVLVQYINWNEGNDLAGDIQFEIVDMKSEQSKYDLVFNFIEMQGETKLVLEYCTKLYRKETVENMVKRLQKIVNEMLSEENVVIDKITHRLAEDPNAVKVTKIQR